MDNLKDHIASLPTITVGDERYLSYQAVSDLVADCLYPTLPADQIDEIAYRRILETADTLCRELGYTWIEKLSPPAVPLNQMGLYWALSPEDTNGEDDGVMVIVAGPGLVEELQAGRLLDARLSQLGLDEVTRQHFKIPVTASDGLIDLMHRAVASEWPNDYRGIWHDIMTMCIAGGQDISPAERLFTVIIHGLGNRHSWRLRARLQHDIAGEPYLRISLADEGQNNRLFELGAVVMTEGAAALGVDFTPYLARHAAGDYGDLDSFDRRQNEIAVKEGFRVLSAYDVPLPGGKTARIWIITEADRRITTVLRPDEY
ncbi:MAG: hypothetical protein L0332_24080 [Chloroflexi bacterium]|nr:hypothetical protein [Chloroflexota bacterium]MCI0645178.1 hypothetical protein [Chloroflexota bacterium]MCI0729773.1 hypothetical protein [Chloroflexota bacterium]